MTQFSVVFVTVGNADAAAAIAKKLVEERMVACANLVPRIRSIYRWKGEIYDEEEYLLIMKTRSSLVPALTMRVRELHSYEVPEIIAVSIEEGLPEYLNWVMENTRED
jgi:periplasmic divalent cation tolerance protein